MAVITEAELVSYLRLSAPDASTALFVMLTNGLIEDIAGTLTPVPTRVKTIALEVAARAYRNPEGYASESIDDYTYRRPTETRSAGIYLTGAEASELALFGGQATGGPFVISLGG